MTDSAESAQANKPIKINPFKNNEFIYQNCKFANIIIDDKKLILTKYYYPTRNQKCFVKSYNLDEEVISFLD